MTITPQEIVWEPHSCTYCPQCGKFEKIPPVKIPATWKKVGGHWVNGNR